MLKNNVFGWFQTTDCLRKFTNSLAIRSCAVTQENNNGNDSYSGCRTRPLQAIDWKIREREKHVFLCVSNSLPHLPVAVGSDSLYVFYRLHSKRISLPMSLFSMLILTKLSKNKKYKIRDIHSSHSISILCFRGNITKYPRNTNMLCISSFRVVFNKCCRTLGSGQYHYYQKKVISVFSKKKFVRVCGLIINTI